MVVFTLSLAAPSIYRLLGPVLGSTMMGIVVVGVTVMIVASKQRANLQVSEAKLKIHSAVYGTGPHDDVDVKNRVHLAATDALVVSVDNNTLGCDPAPGRTKRLKVNYSYGNDAVWTAERWEYSRMILPEDKQFVERTAAEYELKRKSDLEKQRKELESEVEKQRAQAEENFTKFNNEVHEKQNALARERQAIAERDQAMVRAKALEVQEDYDPSGGLLEAGRAAGAIKDAPQLLVEYKRVNSQEQLTLVNDGPITLKDLRVGPVLWSNAFRRELNLHSAVGPIRAAQHVDCRFAVFEQNEGGGHVISGLSSVMREMARKGCEANAEVTAYYEDMSGRRFSRRFVLAIDPWDHIVWNPDPVRREPDASAAP